MGFFLLEKADRIGMLFDKQDRSKKAQNIKPQVKDGKVFVEMYKAYISHINKNKVENEEVESDTQKVDPKVKAKVENIWCLIDAQCQSLTAEIVSKIETNVQSTDWKIVQLFVSSTFADFFNEREVLVKKVFPELREWCHKKHLKLIECDLRWGVPRDTPTEQTVAICLEEIDKCIESSNGCPLFIGLLGERYGWVPSQTDLGPELKERYKWIDDISITSMEILHGAYRCKNPNAAFFIRNPSIYCNIPQPYLKHFVDDNPMSAFHLKTLKEKLCEKFPSQVFQYEAKFKRLADGAGNREPFVEFENYEEFAKNVLEFFKTAILRIHPDQTGKEMNPVEQENEMQLLYILDKASCLIGRQLEKEIIMGYFHDKLDDRLENTDGKTSQLRKLTEWQISDTDKPLCVIEAPSGQGKTTLISSIIKDIINNEKSCRIFYHMVGSTPSSIQIENLLQRLLSALIPNPDDAERGTMDGGRINDQISLLKKAFSDFGKKKSENLWIIVDNVNSLSNSDTMFHLSWLPPLIPSNIRCVVSSNDHIPTTARLYEHPTYRLSLAALTQDELKVIATQYLGNFSKKLHPTQLSSLMTKTKVDNPLWLIFMVEELRIFGSFQQMDQRIAELPTCLDQFLGQVFDRLVKEDPTQNLVKKVLCLIACSRSGLPSNFILEILGDPNTKQPISLLEWFQVQRSLKPYLRSSGFLDEMITFYHDSVQKAVKDHFLSNTADIILWNTALADFYQYSCTLPRMKIQNIFYHFQSARLYKRMVTFMRKDRDSGSLAPFQRSSYLKNCRCRLLADPVLPHNAPMMLCQMCNNKPHGFSYTLNWPNKNCCVVCGNHCFDKCVKAYACMRHNQRRGPDMVKCVLCNFVVNTKMNSSSNSSLRGPPPTQAVLCQHCSFGNGEKLCAVLSCDS